jgi:hypothetical protein
MLWKYTLYLDLSMVLKLTYILTLQNNIDQKCHSHDMHEGCFLKFESQLVAKVIAKKYKFIIGDMRCLV